MFVSTSRFWFRIEFEKSGSSMILSKIIRYDDLLKTLKLHFAIAKKKSVTGEP